MGTLDDLVKQALGGLIRATAKAQLTESGNVHITINIGNHYYYPQTLPQTAVAQIQSSGVTPAQEILIEEETKQRLSAKHLNIDSLPEQERNKLIAGVTTEATVDILAKPQADSIGVTEYVKVELSKPSTGED
jgi:hypothetical protein